MCGLLKAAVVVVGARGTASVHTGMFHRHSETSTLSLFDTFDCVIMSDSLDIDIGTDDVLDFL